MKRQIPPSIWNAENPHVSQMFPPKKNDHACDKKPSRCPLRLVPRRERQCTMKILSLHKKFHNPMHEIQPFAKNPLPDRTCKSIFSGHMALACSGWGLGVWEELYLNTTFGATLSKTELLLRLCQDPSALRDDEDFSVFYPEKEIIQTIHHHHHHHYDRHCHQINQKRQPLQPPWLQLPYIRNPLP